MTFLNTLSLSSIFLLRVALQREQDVIDIEQDIMDLYLFPERLELSYPDEWLAYIKRSLAIHQITLAELEAIMSDEPRCNDAKLAALHNKITKAKPQYTRLLKVITHIKLQNSSANITPIKTPLHKWLDWVIS